MPFYWGDELTVVGNLMRISTALSRDGRYRLFYFRYNSDIFKPSIVNIDNDTSKLTFDIIKNI